ncbi:MAG: hypothetical protein KGI51_01815 [Rhodospirillales bacterium]|nr:hypothetical protein [Rhodospirillales bacterium]
MSEMLRFRAGVVLAALLLGAAGAPPAANPALTQAASQAFMQSCVRFAGEPQALRGWAGRHGLKPIAGTPAEIYLFGLPGAVFAMPAGTGAVTLVSQDSGSCSVIAANARGPDLLRSVNAALAAAGIGFTITKDAIDPRAKDLHDRAYEAHRGERHWLMLVSTAVDPAGGEAILTSNP